MFRRISNPGFGSAMGSPDSHGSARWMLWIDGVGSYRILLADAVTLGQPGGSREADIAVLGDLSTRHARIRRDGEGYLIEAVHEVRVDGRAVQGAAPLEDGSRIALGGAVRLAFRRPHALSASARLEFESYHRTEPPADAVLLVSESCVLGHRPLEGYTIKRGIGQGGFGEVYYATSDAGKEVALKLVRRNLESSCAASGSA
jgi:hypothetical protein